MASVLLVSYHFVPSFAIGGRRPSRFVARLLQRGHSVTVVCGTPLPTDGPELLDATLSPPDPSQVESVDDRAEIIRLATRFPLGRNPQRDTTDMHGVERFWWKARAYAEVFLPTRSWQEIWSRSAEREVTDRIRAGEFDVVIASVPPTSAVHGVVAAARANGVPVIADFRDLHRPGDKRLGRLKRFSASGMRLRRRNRALLDIFEAADRIVFSSEEAAEVARTNSEYIDSDRVCVVTNAFDRVDEDSRPSESATAITLLYTGSLAYGRASQALDLLAGLSEMRRRGRTDLHVRFVGEVTGELRALVEANGLASAVEFSGRLARDEVIVAQREADALLLLQPPGTTEIEVAIPGKLFEYMERRKNVLSLAPGAGDRIVGEYGLGLVVRAAGPTEIADSLCELVDLVRERPVLPPPPEVFSAEATCSEFVAIVESSVA